MPWFIWCLLVYLLDKFVFATIICHSSLSSPHSTPIAVPEKGAKNGAKEHASETLSRAWRDGKCTACLVYLWSLIALWPGDDGCIQDFA
jgi:hypothetical protein